MKRRNLGRIKRFTIITLLIAALMIVPLLPAHKTMAADVTKSQGELYDWTLLDDTGATPYLETGVHSYPDTLSSMLNVSMVNIGAVADASSVGFMIFTRFNAADDGWRLFADLKADVAVAVTIDVDAQAASGQTVIPLSNTTNFDEVPGSIYFLRDTTLANSELIIWGGTFDNDVSITAIDNLVATHENTADIYKVVSQWNIVLPNGCDEAKVLFYNRDADANYACRVDYANEDDIQ